MILASGYSVGKDALATLFPTQIGELSEDGQDSAGNLPSMEAAWFALVSVMVKRYLSAESK